MKSSQETLKMSYVSPISGMAGITEYDVIIAKSSRESREEKGSRLVCSCGELAKENAIFAADD
jgi:hypothetical protein